MADLAFDQPDVALEAQQALGNRLRVGHLQADRRLGVLAHVFRDEQRAQVIADGQRGPHRQRRQAATAQVGLDFPGLVEQLLSQRQ